MYAANWHRPPAGRPPGGHSFHELPLVLFSALASAACGLALCGWPLPWLLPAAPAPPVPLPALSTLFMGLALIASLFHLGRPARAWRALFGLRTSPLSHEILLALLFLVLTTSTWLLSPGGLAPAAVSYGNSIGRLLGQGSGAIALIFFVVLHRVYALPGQPAWGWPASLGAPLLGSAFGLMLIAFVYRREPAAAAAAVLLLIDLALAIYRIRWYRTLQCLGRPLYLRAWQRRRLWFTLRLAIANVLPLLLAMAGSVAPAAESPALAAAAGLIVLGLLVDRACFYLLALPRSTENEQTRIERIIRAAGRNLSKESAC